MIKLHLDLPRSGNDNMRFNLLPFLKAMVSSGSGQGTQSTAPSSHNKQFNTAIGKEPTDIDPKLNSVSGLPAWLNGAPPTTAKAPYWASDRQPTNGDPSRKSCPFASITTASAIFTKNDPYQTKIHESPATLTPMFCTTSINNPSYAPAIDMSDAEFTSFASLPTPPATPPSEIDCHGAKLNSRQSSPVDTTSYATSPCSSNPPLLQPQRQEQRYRPYRVKRSFSAEVIMEEDDGTLPEGYLGTHGNIQYYAPKVDTAHTCGDIGLHELVCGHWIMHISKLNEPRLPCGLNCTKPNINVPAFNCPQCEKIIMNILENQLTGIMKQKLDSAQKAGNELFLISYIVEVVAACKIIEANITETVMAIIDKNYGRKCTEAAPPEPIRYLSPAEMAQAVHESRMRKEFAKNNTLSEPIKRSRMQSSTLFESSTSILSDANTTVHTNKRQKTKLETHREPISPKTAHGQKRGPTFDDMFRPKRVAIAPPVQYGEVSWPTPPSNVVGLSCASTR